MLYKISHLFVTLMRKSHTTTVVQLSFYSYDLITSHVISLLWYVLFVSLND